MRVAMRGKFLALMVGLAAVVLPRVALAQTSVNCIQTGPTTFMGSFSASSTATAYNFQPCDAITNKGLYLTASAAVQGPTGSNAPIGFIAGTNPYPTQVTASDGSGAIVTFTGISPYDILQVAATKSPSSGTTATFTLYNNLNGQPGTLTFTVTFGSGGGSTAASTVTTVSTSANPSVAGASVTITATVTSNGSPVTTGTVTIGYGNSSYTSALALNTSGQAQYTTFYNAAGSYNITASYSGTSAYAASNSSNLTQNVKDAPTLSLTSSANPSVSGGSVTFTATLSGLSSSQTITFYDGSASIGTGTLTLYNNVDSATFTTSSLAVGTHSITASYPGDQNDFSATSSAVSQIINPASSVWIVNEDGSVSQLFTNGTVRSTQGSATGTTTYGGIAVDGNGTSWSVQANTNQVIAVSSTDSTQGTFTGGGLFGPTAVAVDGNGRIWLANENGTVSEFFNTGTAVTPSTGYKGTGSQTGAGVAVDGSGSVWVTNSNSNTVTRYFGAAAPVVTPQVTAITNGTQGTRP